MNKENTLKEAEHHAKNQQNQENLVGGSLDVTKMVFDNLIENGGITRKLSDKMEDSCPIGAYLMRRKWELSKIIVPPFTEIKLLPCNS